MNITLINAKIDETNARIYARPYSGNSPLEFVKEFPCGMLAYSNGRGSVALFAPVNEDNALFQVNDWTKHATKSLTGIADTMYRPTAS